ncbi:Butyrophilin-like protein 2 [Cricetulus griseus]|uniref:Butyrophilin-like protein 2 n=1 Tax=Cricetulus griseus TaxID=10029 RepID=G3ILD1_CRIGR|nr:Butyrophilin-like protein 2 [Cricetulus griseus]
MADCPGYSLSGVAASLLFILLTVKHPDEFRVTGPALPVLAKVGEDALLTCQLLPRRTAAHMEVRWYRSDPDAPLIVHRHGAQVAGLQVEGYRGRVEWTEDSADEGSVSLRIRQIHPGDDGQYWCRFQEGDYWGEASVLLQVAALGSNSNIHIEGPGEGEVQLVCISQGWFPEPGVYWEGSWGEKLLSFSENHMLGEDGLFYVEDTLVVRNDTSETISCSIYNRDLKEAKEATIVLPVHVSVDGAHWAGEQMAEYRGRTVVMPDAIHEGKLTLQIHDARISDDGEYRCLFGKDGVYQEARMDVQVMDSKIALLWMALPVLVLPLAMAIDLIKVKHRSKEALKVEEEEEGEEKEEEEEEERGEEEQGEEKQGEEEEEQEEEEEKKKRKEEEEEDDDNRRKKRKQTFLLAFFKPVSKA